LHDDLEAFEAAEREERAREAAERQAAEEAARRAALVEDQQRQAAAAAAGRRASEAVKNLEALLEAATADGRDEQQVQELQAEVAAAVAAAEEEAHLLAAQTERVEMWARQHFSEGYLRRILDSQGEAGQAAEPLVGADGAPVDVIRLDLSTAERGAARQTIVTSRHGAVSRHGDRHQVAAKCQAAAAAFDRFERLLAAADASKEDIAGALEEFQRAQEVCCGCGWVLASGSEWLWVGGSEW